MAGQDGVVLRLVLKENTTDNYKVESKATQVINLPNGMGEQEMTILTTSSYKVTTGKVDAEKGVADVTVETSVDKIDADGPMGEMMAQNKPKPMTLKGTLNNLGKLTLDTSKLSMSDLQFGGGSQQSGGGVYVEFPDKAIKVGDSWDYKIPKSPITGSEDQKMTLKLVGEKKVGDKDVWVISTTGTMKLDIDSSKLPKGDADAGNPMAGQDMKIKGTIDVVGESLVEKATGRTLKSEAKLKSKNTIEVMGMNIDSTGTTIVTSTLQG